MISLTDQAASAIRRMTNTETYPDAGLRIKSEDDHRFAMTIVPRPQADDVTLRSPGVNLYLDHDAAGALNRAVLDAADDTTRAEEFTLGRLNN